MKKKRKTNEVADEEYEMEDILEYKRLNNTDRYLVKWEGYPIEESTWEPKSNIISPGSELEDKMIKLKDEYFDNLKKISTSSHIPPIIKSTPSTCKRKSRQDGPPDQQSDSSLSTDIVAASQCDSPNDSATITNSKRVKRVSSYSSETTNFEMYFNLKSASHLGDNGLYSDAPTSVVVTEKGETSAGPSVKNKLLEPELQDKISSAPEIVEIIPKTMDAIENMPTMNMQKQALTEKHASTEKEASTEKQASTEQVVSNAEPPPAATKDKTISVSFARNYMDSSDIPPDDSVIAIVHMRERDDAVRHVQAVTKSGAYVWLPVETARKKHCQELLTYLLRRVRFRFKSVTPRDSRLTSNGRVENGRSQ